MKFKALDIWCIASPIIMLVVCLITKAGWQEIVTSVTGMIYLSLIANQNKYGYLFSIVNVIFYAILTWNKGLFGTAIFNIVYSLPVLIYGFVFWSKKQNSENSNVKRMKGDSRTKIVISMIGIIAIYYFIAYYLLKIDNALIDAIVVCFSFIGNLLMARKYIEQWVIWITLNIINIYFWVVQAVNDSDSISIVALWIMYLINNIIGLVSWNKANKGE